MSFVGLVLVVLKLEYELADLESPENAQEAELVQT